MRHAETEVVPIGDLTPHPRNYRNHPEIQIEHIANSIRENGFYRNVVVARDFTILAGHGSVLAAAKVGLELIPIVKLDTDPLSPQALKILAGDNEVARLGVIDDVALADILKSIVEDSGGTDALLGTGFDDEQFAFVIGVADGDIVEADQVDPYAEWKDMPAYEHTAIGFRRIVVHFKDQAAVEQFAEMMGQKLTDKTRAIWHPEEKPVSNLSIRYGSDHE